MEYELSQRAISKIKIKPGMIFDDYVVESLNSITPQRKYLWNCRCLICNERQIFSTRRLMDDRPVKCRAHRKYDEPDITGNKYGFMFVDGLSDQKSDDGYNLWNCHCVICDKTFLKTFKQLKLIRGQSCGCLRNKKNHEKMIDMTGKTYNNIFVLGKAEQNKKWNCRCLLCGKEFVADGANVRRGNTSSCGCTRFEKLREIKFHDITNQIFGDVLVKSFAGYENQRAMWNCYCMLCNSEFVSSGHDILAGDVKSCGCGKSNPERIIMNYLQQQKINFVHQKKFIGCKNKRSLPFDFYLPDYNLAIEYDGELHYMETTLKNNLERTKKYDAIKTKYCEENDIILLRIPYWEKDNIESILSEWLNIDCVEEANSSNADLSA